MNTFLAGCKWVLANWKGVLIGLAALAILWAFTPSCALRKSKEAEVAAQQAIQEAKQEAKQHQERANAAEATANQEAAKRQALEVEREALAKDKAKLTAEVAALRGKISPKPSVADPGMGADERAQWVLAVATRDAALAADAELIAKHEEDDKKTQEFIASLQRSEESWKTAMTEQKTRGDDLERALAAKDLQIKEIGRAHV